LSFSLDFSKKKFIRITEWNAIFSRPLPALTQKHFWMSHETY
jgi:hypothetical protein